MTLQLYYVIATATDITKCIKMKFHTK